MKPLIQKVIQKNHNKGKKKKKLKKKAKILGNILDVVKGEDCFIIGTLFKGLKKKIQKLQK
jgi:hypothetical protein